MESIPIEADTRTLEEHFMSIGDEDLDIIWNYVGEKHKDVGLTCLVPRELYSFKVPGYDDVIFYNSFYARIALNSRSTFSREDYIRKGGRRTKAVGFDFEPWFSFCYVAVYKDSQLVIPVEQMDASLLAQLDEVHLQRAKNEFGSYARPLEETFVSLCKEDIIKINEYINIEYEEALPRSFSIPDYKDIKFYALSHALKNLNQDSKISRKDYEEHCQFMANAVSFKDSSYTFLYVAVVEGSKLITNY